jgi:hypothetical protein
LSVLIFYLISFLSYTSFSKQKYIFSFIWLIFIFIMRLILTLEIFLLLSTDECMLEC